MLASSLRSRCPCRRARRSHHHITSNSSPMTMTIHTHGATTSPAVTLATLLNRPTMRRGAGFRNAPLLHHDARVPLTGDRHQYLTGRLAAHRFVNDRPRDGVTRVHIPDPDVL